MNRYILIRRLRWPAILLLIGVLALLDEAGAIEDFWSLFWPLLLIMLGVMLLAERAALAMYGYDPQMQAGCDPCGPYAGAPYAGGPYGAPYTGTPQAPAAQAPGDAGTAIVPAEKGDLMRGFGNGGDGGER
jgi:hypothetical protein